MNQTQPMAIHPAAFRALIALLSFCAFHFSPRCAAQETNRAAEPRAAAQSQPSRNPDPSMSFAPLVEKVSPSVVTVFTTKSVSPNEGMLPFLDDPVLRRFFGGEIPQSPGTQKLQGLGSGVIVAADGYILTANHVVEGADEIMIGRGTEARKSKAKKVGSDPGTDIALLKIDADGLPAIDFADSDKARPGDVVLALGNPFGLLQTVTSGIISAVGRGGMGIIDYENFIQTDAAINMGNSGGALVDTSGRLVGINSAIFSRSGGNQGIGFAIPSNLARDVMQSLREKGRVVRASMGVAVQTLTPELAEALKLKEDAGALIGEVMPKSPAEKAGIKSGDVITAVNGKKISDARELRLIIGSMAPGTKVKLDANRESQKKTFDVELVELPAKEAQPEASPTQNVMPEKSPIFGGVIVADIDDDVRQFLKLPKEIQGAVIAEIDPASPAAAAGLREGDVIQEINKQPVKGAKELVALTRKLNPDEKILLRVWSQGKSGFVALTPK
jgi:serine protease Do